VIECTSRAERLLAAETMKPKLRDIEVHSILHQGQPMFLLRDGLRLSETTIAVPRPLGPLLALMDGTRDTAELEAALRIRTGVRLAPGLLGRLLSDLDSAFLLENERYAAARADALQAFRQAPFRPLTIEGSGFPAEAEEAAEHLKGYLEALSPADPPLETLPIRGLVSPHIDYERGGAVYAQVWRATAHEAQESDLVLMLGTDHQGSCGTLTLTRQSYATPWGVLPTDLEVVDGLAGMLGEEAAFAEELHHRTEHSIELAAIWLHFIRKGRAVPIVPVLCGSFARFLTGEADPAIHSPFLAAVGFLGELLARKRVLVVAAADLAHVGPAFGDPHGVDFVGRAQLRNADDRLLSAVFSGDASAFFSQLQAERDRRHVCGLPPIYLALRLLGKSQGEAAGYAICPADPQGISFVSIAGIVLR